MKRKHEKDMDVKKSKRTRKLEGQLREREDKHNTMAPAQVAEMISGWKNTIVSLGK